MLIPHLHFYGCCKEAIALYEKAFDTKSDTIIYNYEYAAEECKNDDRIAHATMLIHGQRVMLNDRFGNKDRATDCAVHIILTFKNKEELIECYEIMKQDSITVDPMQELSYSPLVVQFIDKFGVLWGFMADQGSEA